MSLDLCHRSATDLAAAIRAGELSPVDLTRAHLDRIAAIGDRTNAFVTVLVDEAMERAREAERAVENGEELGPLHGVPVAIKDLSFRKAGVPHTRGMKPLAGNVAEEDSVGVERIEAAGGIVIGTTNTPEMGHTPRTYNELVGPTGTPFDPSYNAGGSSGGSAAALAEGLCPLATGSDVGGSLRVPASCCGVASVKPTFGLLPRENRPNAFGGHTPFAVIGPMARTVDDLGLLLSVLAGRDDRDPFSVPAEGSYTGIEAADPADLTLGFSADLDLFAVEPAVERVVREAVVTLERDGTTVVEVAVDGPDYGDLTRAYGVSATVSFASSARALEREFDLDLAGEDADEVSDSFVRTLELGRGHGALDYLATDEVRTELYDAVEAALSGVDALVCPTLATPPLTHDEPFPTEIAGESARGLPMDWMLAWLFNMTGHPVVCVPAGLTDEGLPVGLQVVGPRFAEAELLAVGKAFEEASSWAESYPRIESGAEEATSVDD
jgi:Asp-tRNA(Asn)/Glu-tRNA(Gln) amidotransferase A subunit family amidase